MEHKGDPSTDTCDHCGQPTISTSKASAPHAPDLAVVDPVPLFEVWTPDGRVVYVVNLN